MIYNSVQNFIFATKFSSIYPTKGQKRLVFQLSFVNLRRAKDGTHMSDAKYSVCCINLIKSLHQITIKVSSRKKVLLLLVIYLTAEGYVSRSQITSLSYCYNRKKIKRIEIVRLFNSLWPSDAVWQQRYGSTLAPSRHYLNQCWLIISDIHIRTISQEMPQPPITKICLKITCLKFHSNFPGPMS